MALILSISSAPAPAQTLSGNYGPLLLVERDGRVSGAFSEARIGNGTEDAPQFTCIFLFDGALTGRQAAIGSRFPGDPERIAGTLRVAPEGISVQFDTHLPGCAMASGDMVTEPYALTMDHARGDWIGVGIVKVARAMLLPRPGGQAGRRTPYLIRHDAAAVLERRNAWTRIEYAGGDKQVSGWVRSADLAVAADLPLP